MAALGSRTSQLHALVTYASGPANRVAQLSGMAVYAPDQVRYTRIGQLLALVPYSRGVYAIPRVSQLSGAVVWAPGAPGESRTRAWTFVLDGHVFYVLDLGQEGTFLYDMTTKQWCQFITNGHEGWNVRNGTVWGDAGRIAGADTTDTIVWELDPEAVVDDGFRTITHAVTGGVTTRSRVYKSVEAVRIAGSIGSLEGDSASTFTMRFSDDGGNTWSDDFVVDLVQGEFDGEIAWRSLGSFMAPGRVFEFSDIGGPLRIDGADVFIEDFDGEDGG